MTPLPVKTLLFNTSMWTAFLSQAIVISNVTFLKCLSKNKTLTSNVLRSLYDLSLHFRSKNNNKIQRRLGPGTARWGTFVMQRHDALKYVGLYYLV